MRLFGILFLLWVFAASPALAQQETPESLQVAKELMEVSRANATYMRVLDSLSQKFLPLISQANPGNQQMVKDMYESVFAPALKQHSQEIIDAMASVYAESFSVDEMQQLIAFYQSPIGQKYLDRMPLLTSAITQRVQPVMQGIIVNAVHDLTAKLRQNNLQVPNGVAQ